MPSQAWNTDQVGQWISSLGFPQYSKSFIDNNITGDVLVHLDHDDISDIGVSKIGHRVLILKSIYQLKEKEGGTYDNEGDGDRGGYVPPSIKTTADPDDYNRLFKSFEIRDERVYHVEQELKKLIDSFNKIREDLLPLFKFVKESKPLPTPDGTNPIHGHYLHSPGTPSDSHAGGSNTAAKESSSSVNNNPAPSIVRKLSKLNNKSAQKSPTTMEPESGSSSNNAGSSEQSQQKRPNLYLGSVKSLLSPSDSSVAATPVVTPGGSTTLQFSHPYQSGSAASSQVNFSNSSLVSPGAQPSSSNAQSSSSNSLPTPTNPQPTATPATEPFKSFRVTLDDPCYKVLPAALRRYKINGDWKQYALLVCYGDQERLLGLEEKPLIIFKELQDAGKQPVFMLRHIEGMKQSGVVVGTPGGVL